jgi:hypothetical protein
MMNALISSHHQASIPQSEQGKPRNASVIRNKNNLKSCDMHQSLEAQLPGFFASFYRLRPFVIAMKKLSKDHDLTALTNSPRGQTAL